MSRVSVKLSGVDKALGDIEEEVIHTVNQGLRLNALQAQAALQLTTPVKTGRARSSWTISSIQGQARDLATGANLAVPFLAPPSKNKYDTLYLNNGVPYIQDLNMGRSNQAPARFIEGTVFRYFSPKGVAVQVLP